ncbi:MAG: hypothetical protein GEV28_30640 [Actinophytocola sp.]|uniref:hypothetical protein n=1 Tax=Actinophytocola sp. TaxID=1872138 RepID=UPI0013231CE1|nr:hypothetical protein [Actinophytocola sp.]MPZ84511.1 hypothetical protein [Actinophytocola sp.]
MGDRVLLLNSMNPAWPPTTATRCGSFLHFGPDGWETVAGGNLAGCASVRPEHPDFPEALCRNLPPVT